MKAEDLLTQDGAMQLALGYCVGCKNQVDRPEEFEMYVIRPLAKLCGRDPETLELIKGAKNEKKI